jgi:hypothetical protein
MIRIIFSQWKKYVLDIINFDEFEMFCFICFKSAISAIRNSGLDNVKQNTNAC